MSDEMRKVGQALRKAGCTADDPLRSKIEEGTETEGAWKAGLPPAKYFLDAETQEEVQSPVKHPVYGASDVPPALEQRVLEMYGEGVPAAELERKFDLGRGYVRNALLRRFGSEESLKKALKSLLLENAVATSQHTLAHVESLHPSQSGMLAATMTNAFIALDKHEKNSPRVIDFEALAEFGETLSRIEKYAGIAQVVSDQCEEDSKSLMVPDSESKTI